MPSYDDIVVWIDPEGNAYPLPVTGGPMTRVIEIPEEIIGGGGGAGDADVAGYVADTGSDTRAALNLVFAEISDLAAVATTGDYADLINAPAVPDSADDIGAVPDTRTINGAPLSGDVTLTQDDIGDGTNFKQFSAAEETKLAGIATAATANSSDATLLNRANHTGTQLLATISDVTASAAEVNILDGATLTVTELNYVDGVTSAIQTQLNGKITGLNDADNLWIGTQAEYDLISGSLPAGKNAYFITEA